MGITSNCYRLHGFIYSRKKQDLVQLDYTGDLLEILLFLKNNLRPSDHIQLLVIENEDCEKCSEWAISEYIAIASIGKEDVPSHDDLRCVYDNIYCRDPDYPSKVLTDILAHLKHSGVDQQ